MDVQRRNWTGLWLRPTLGSGPKRETLMNLANPTPAATILILSCFPPLMKKKNNEAWIKKNKSIKRGNSAYKRTPWLINTEHRLWGTTQSLLESSATLCLYLDVVRAVAPVAVRTCKVLSVCCISYPNQIMLLHAWKVEHVNRRVTGTTSTAQRYHEVILSDRCDFTFFKLSYCICFIRRG